MLKGAAPILMPLVAWATDGPPPPGDYLGPQAAKYDDWDSRWIGASRRCNTNRAFSASVARMPFTTLGRHLRELRAQHGQPASTALRVLLLTAKDDKLVRDVDVQGWRDAFAACAVFRAEPPMDGAHGFHVEFELATSVLLQFLEEEVRVSSQSAS